MEENTLLDYRNQLDSIDRTIIMLLNQRMSISKEIGEYKAKYSLPVMDAQRELKILDKVVNLSEQEYSAYVRNIYCSILAESKNIQMR